MESKVKIIRPAGAFPANDEGWRQYEEQYADEMKVDNRLSCFISKPNPDFVVVKKNNHMGYTVSVKNEIILFFDNYDELCIFGQAIADGIEKLKETKIGDEEDGNY
jgi:hypothetical protein